MSKNEQEYLLAKLMLNHYGLMHEYFITQMRCYTIACCNISVGGSFKIINAEKAITYEIFTEKFYKNLKKKKSKLASMISMTNSKYKSERSAAAKNLKVWTKDLLSWKDADIRVVIDGTEQE